MLYGISPSAAPICDGDSGGAGDVSRAAHCRSTVPGRPQLHWGSDLNAVQIPERTNQNHDL